MNRLWQGLSTTVDLLLPVTILEIKNMFMDHPAREKKGVFDVFLSLTILDRSAWAARLPLCSCDRTYTLSTWQQCSAVAPQCQPTPRVLHKALTSQRLVSLMQTIATTAKRPSLGAWPDDLEVSVRFEKVENEF